MDRTLVPVVMDSWEMELTAKVAEMFIETLTYCLIVQISMSALLMEQTTVPDHLMERVPIL